MSSRLTIKSILHVQEFSILLLLLVVTIVIIIITRLDVLYFALVKGLKDPNSSSM